jgi:hypothetical protein
LIGVVLRVSVGIGRRKEEKNKKKMADEANRLPKVFIGTIGMVALFVVSCNILIAIFRVFNGYLMLFCAVVWIALIIIAAIELVEWVVK